MKQHGAKPPIRKVMLSLPEELYKRLGHHSVETDRTMSNIETAALHLYFETGGKRTAPRPTRGAIVDRKEHFADRP